MAEPFGQPQIAPPGMPPPGGMEMFAQIASLAQNMPKTAMDKVREAMRLLDEARDEDPKVAGNVSMAMNIIRQGPKAMEKYGYESPKGQPGSRQNSE